MSEVEKILEMAEAFADIYSEAIHEHYVHNQSHQGLAPMREELRAAVEALVTDRDRWKELAVKALAAKALRVEFQSIDPEFAKHIQDNLKDLI